MAANINPDNISVCNNSIWAIGEIAMRLGNNIKPFLPNIVQPLIIVITRDRPSAKTLQENCGKLLNIFILIWDFYNTILQPSLWVVWDCTALQKWLHYYQLLCVNGVWHFVIFGIIAKRNQPFMECVWWLIKILAVSPITSFFFVMRLFHGMLHPINLKPCLLMSVFFLRLLLS